MLFKTLLFELQVLYTYDANLMSAILQYRRSPPIYTIVPFRKALRNSDFAQVGNIYPYVMQKFPQLENPISVLWNFFRKCEFVQVGSSITRGASI